MLRTNKALLRMAKVINAADTNRLDSDPLVAGFALVIMIPAWQAVLVGAVLFKSWSAISLPATMSLI